MNRERRVVGDNDNDSFDILESDLHHAKPGVQAKAAVHESREREYRLTPSKEGEIPRKSLTERVREERSRPR